MAKKLAHVDPNTQEIVLRAKMEIRPGCSVFLIPKGETKSKAKIGIVLEVRIDKNGQEVSQITIDLFALGQHILVPVSTNLWKTGTKEYSIEVIG